MDKQYQSGLLLASSSYVIWGLAPIYWRLFSNFPQGPVIAQRILWSLLYFGVVYLFVQKFNLVSLRKMTLKDWILCLLATFFIIVNWTSYLYAVAHQMVLEGSFALFMSPILSLVIGLFFFKEKATLPLKISIGLVLLAFSVKFFNSPVSPWLCLLIGGSFSIYGAIKKLLKVPVTTTMLVEILIALPPAIIYLSLQSGPSFDYSSLSQWLLFAGSGLVSALPLFLFSSAAQRLPYSAMAILQYIGPGLQFICAVFLFKEAFKLSDAISFFIIWIAIAIFSIPHVHQLRKVRFQS